MPINDDFTYDRLIAKTDDFEPYGDKDFEKISIMKSVPWYADFVNYLAADIIPPDLNYQQKRSSSKMLNIFTGKNHSYSREK